MTDNTTPNKAVIETMFKAGAHFGYTRSRRHPTITPFIFGAKNKVEILDLEKTQPLLNAALEYIKSVAKEGKNVLFVGGKSEARAAIKKAGLALAMPHVDGRWIGGTLTNFPEIRRRIEKLERLTTEREKGELAKYTKKERLLIDREISNLEIMFAGLGNMKELPKVLFVIDPKKEAIAVEEAKYMKIPVIALLGTDCNLKDVTYPVVGNDSSKTSIEFFVNEVVKAYEAGRKTA